MNGIIGMVSGHPNAHTVSLTRWSQKVMAERDFQALLSAISSGSRSSRYAVRYIVLLLSSMKGREGAVMLLGAPTARPLESARLTSGRLRSVSHEAEKRPVLKV